MRLFSTQTTSATRDKEAQKTVYGGIVRLSSLMAILCCVAACGAPSNPGPAKPSPVGDIAEPLATPMCMIPDGRQIAVYTDAYSGCHSPNGSLMQGLLCFSGEQWACDVMDVFLTDDSLVKDPINIGADHGGSGSRDELLGHLAYLVRTHDKEHAKKLLKMIQGNGNRVCTDDTDGRCYVTPAMYGLMKIVWQHIGLDPSPNMVIGNAGDDTALAVSAKSATVGYQLHLVAIQLLIRAHTNTWSSACQEAAKILLQRMPSNLLIRHINGLDVSKELDKAIRDQLANPPAVVRDWPWARETTGNEDTPAGYVVLRNLILKK